MADKENDEGNQSQEGYFKSLWKSVKTETRKLKAKFFLELGTLIGLIVYAEYTIKMYHANKEAADAARDTAKIAADTLMCWLSLKWRGDVFR